jgi:acetyl-CoA/propionyl-CoA carboxylase carboxyl transferase subunit
VTVLDTKFQPNPAAGVDGAAGDGEPTAADPRDPQVRLEALFDEGTFRAFAGDDKSGKLAGQGRIEGLPVVAFASDPRVMGGAMGMAGCEAIVAAYDLAIRERLPIIGLWHSGGARLAEGVESLHAVGLVFAAQTRASGIIPQISVVLGPAAGGAAYGPALTDIVILSEAGRIFVTGPDVVKSVTGEEIDQAGLGGAEAHGKKSGVAHITTKDDTSALSTARKLAVLLGHQGRVHMDEVEERDFSDVLPENVKRAYNVLPLVKGVSDDGVVEMHAKWAPNIVTALGRLGGRTVGIIANNPLRLGGCLDSISAEKCARFVRMCDAFGVPLVVLVDVPGYLPGVGQEHGGVVRRGAKLLHAFAEATVPRVTLVTRKAYGGAYIAMNSRSLGATKVFGWPTAEVAVMGALAAVRVLHRKKISAVSEEERPAFEQQLAEEHEKIAGGLQRAIDLGVVDEVIEPTKTRTALARAIAEATPARGSHNNIPL